MTIEAKWEQIDEFPNYYISDGGLVINLSNGKIRATFLVGGVEYVRFHKEGRPYQRSIEKLMIRYHGR